MNFDHLFIVTGCNPSHVAHVAIRSSIDIDRAERIATRDGIAMLPKWETASGVKVTYAGIAKRDW